MLITNLWEYIVNNYNNFNKNLGDTHKLSREENERNLGYQFDFLESESGTSIRTVVIHLNRRVQEQSGSVNSKWISDISAIPGIKDVMHYSQHVRLERNPGYAWINLLPPVLEILRQAFTPNGKAKEIAPPRRRHLESMNRFQIFD